MPRRLRPAGWISGIHFRWLGIRIDACPFRFRRCLPQPGFHARRVDGNFGLRNALCNGRIVTLQASEIVSGAATLGRCRRCRRAIATGSEISDATSFPFVTMSSSRRRGANPSAKKINPPNSRPSGNSNGEYSATLACWMPSTAASRSAPGSSRPRSVASGHVICVDGRNGAGIWTKCLFASTAGFSRGEQMSVCVRPFQVEPPLEPMFKSLPVSADAARACPAPPSAAAGSSRLPMICANRAGIG